MRCVLRAGQGILDLKPLLTPSLSPAQPLAQRLAAAVKSGLPLLLGPSLDDVFVGERADEEDPTFGVVRALRRAAPSIVEVQRRVLEAGADIVIAPTASTTAPSLDESGQGFRAAALTGKAIDLSREAVLSCGTLASIFAEVNEIPGLRPRAEAFLHVERLANSAIDGILVKSSLTIDEGETLAEIVRAAVDRAMPLIVEIDALHVPAFFAKPRGPLRSSLVMVRGEDAAIVAQGLADVRLRFPSIPVGARILVSDDGADAQMAIAACWGLFSTLKLAVIGVSGHASLAALAALVDLVRAERASLSVRAAP
ncbi:MAG: hypothetical protein NVS3B20_20710 [Polyangiales bacterium]